MTSRQLYQALLIELNKVNAPIMLLEDFNYSANVAIYHYINKKYNVYDTSQQLTDDLRELKASIILPVTEDNKINTYDSLDLITYQVNLPNDYLHILNCICIYEVNNKYKCMSPGCTCKYKATKLTADAYSEVLDNYWNRPTFKRPYYYIHNVNSKDSVPTNPYNNIDNSGTDFNDIENLGKDGNGNDIVTGKGTPKTIKIKIGNTEHIISNVERGAEIRYGNVFQVRLEIRYENDNSKVKLKQVYIDYLKTPQNVLLTQEQLDKVEDTSQMLEFSDYICHEIVNELVHIVMENSSNQRLQTHPVVNQSIANPTQQQTPDAVG